MVGLLWLLCDITERRRARAELERRVEARTAALAQTLTALQESKARYRQMFEHNRAVKLLIDPETAAIVDANPAAAAFYGYSLEALRRMQITDIDTLPLNQMAHEMRQAMAEERPYFLFRHRLGSGAIRHVKVLSSPLDLGGRRLLYSIVHDITTECRQAEQTLQRMKDELEQRIQAMALVHDILYRTEDLAHLDLGHYLGRLADELVKAYGVDPARIHLTSQLDAAVVGLDTAIPCGLLLQELLTNCFKHAFADHRRGEIGIAFRAGRAGSAVLRVPDTGVGLPADLDFHATESLGLQLVCALTEAAPGHHCPRARRWHHGHHYVSPHAGSARRAHGEPCRGPSSFTKLAPWRLRASEGTRLCRKCEGSSASCLPYRPASSS
jgi:PAS domain S-box-containing protein